MKGIKLVAIVMAVMVIIGTMMVPAHADYERTATFEERFEVLFDLYLKREGLEDYFVIDSIDEYTHCDLSCHIVAMTFTDTAIEDIISNMDIVSNDVEGSLALCILEDNQYFIIATLYVDGEEYTTECASGDDIFVDFNLI